MTASTAIEIVVLIVGGLTVRALVLRWGRKYLQRPAPGPRPEQRIGSVTKSRGKRR